MNKIKLAGCVILDKNEKVLLLHRNTVKRVHWEFPGGKIEKNEEPEEAALRECKEEIGIKPEIIKELGTKDFEENGFIFEYTCFLAKISQGTPHLLEKEKFDKLGWFSWNEIEEIKAEFSANTKNFINLLFIAI